MAYIAKRGKNYTITVSCGYDTSGKQIKQHMTYKPTATTPKQIEKEVQKQAVIFEVAPYGLQTKGLIFNVTKPFLYALVRICI